MSLPGSISTKLSDASKPNRIWASPVAWVGIWLASVTACTVLVSGIVWTLRAKSTLTRTDREGWLWGSQELKTAALREGYNGRRSSDTLPQYAEIQAFLSEVTKESEDVDDSRWKRSIDTERFLARYKQSPPIKSLSIIERRDSSRRTIEELSIDAPNRFAKIDVVRIVPWQPTAASAEAQRDEKLVFTFGQRGYAEWEPVLFWLRKTGESWKLVDWEWVDVGVSESESAALWESATYDQRNVSFTTANQLLMEVDQLDFSKTPEAERLLKRAEAYDVPPQMRNIFTYMLMTRWGHRSQELEVKRLANQISDPDRIPGVLVLRANACEELGESDEAILLWQRIEELVGFRPDLARRRAKVLEQSGQRDAALADWRRLADFEEENASTLMELYTHLPKNQRSEVFDRIRKSANPTKLAYEFGLMNAYRLRPETLQEVSNLLKEIAPESNESRQIEILRLSRSNQHRAAAELCRQAIRENTEPEEQDRLWIEYLQEMRFAGELVAGFMEHPDAHAAFHLIVRGLDEGDGMVPTEELPKLLEAYRSKVPDDPWILFYEGYLAAEDQRFEEADKKFAEVETRLASRRKESSKSTVSEESGDTPTATDDLESLIEQLKYQRSHTRFELGEDVEILKDNKFDEGTYQALTGFAIQFHDWNALDRLNQACEVSAPKMTWLPYNQARVLLARGDFEGVRRKLLNMVNRETEAPWMSYSRKRLESDLFSAEFSDPLESFRHATDQNESFSHISQELLTKRDWPTLENLIRRYTNDVNDPTVAAVRLEMAWRQSDDATIVAQLTPWPVPVMAKQRYFESTWRERLVRSLLRLGRIDEARTKATEYEKRFGEVWPLVMCDVTQNQAQEIERRLEEDEDFAANWQTRDLAADSSLRAILLNMEFANLREKYPVALPHYEQPDSLILLLSNPVELTSAFLTERLSDSGPNGKIQPAVTPIRDSTFVVEWRGARFVIGSIPQPYFSPELLAEPAFARRHRDITPEMSALLREQRSYLRIASLSSAFLGAWNSPETTARELGARLLDENTLGAVNQPPYTTASQVIRLDRNQIERLASRQPFVDLDHNAIVIRTPVGPDHLDETVKGLLAKQGENQLTPNLPFVAEVSLGPASFAIHIPIHVHEIRPTRFGEHELIGEYLDHEYVAGFPELRRGTRFIIPQGQVVSLEQQAVKTNPD